MRSLISCCVVAAFLVLLTTAPPASADTLTLNAKITQNAYSAGTGGEFTAEPNFGVLALGPNVQVGPAGSFETFCIERNEYFTPGTTYWVSIEPWAIFGGESGQDVSASQDSVDPKTAYLFTQFWNGALSSYDYTNGAGQRNADAGSLQNAIWSIEGETAALDAQALLWIAEATANAGPGIGNVRAMNLWSTKYLQGSNHWDDVNKQFKIQSMLVMVPLPATTYASFVMLGLISVLRLRRNRAQA